MVNPVAVDRAEIVEIKCFKEHSGCYECLEGFFEPLHQLVSNRTLAQKRFEFLAPAKKTAGRGKFAGEKAGQGTDIGCNGHVIVIQHHNEVFLEPARLV